MPSQENTPASNVPYFTPYQQVPSGKAEDPASAPTLFQPFKIRGVEFQNRIWLSPLCQYSADDGHFTEWHVAHLGGIFTRGPSLTIIEATSVTPEGRITPQDSGLWKDSQIAPLKRVVDFAHSQNQKIAIQLAHAGRKASTNAPWISGPALATKELHGWPDAVIGPSDIPFAEDYPKPIALTKEGIEQLKKDWVAAAKRAVQAGFDVIEIHNAHGYLLSSFLSPTSNNRTDEYGGSFENRIRLTVEIVELLRANIPDSTPLILRVSGTEWLDHLPEVESWTSDDTVRLAKVLATKGVDLLDVSSGGNDSRQKISPLGHELGYQVPLAAAVTKALKADGLSMLVGTVGGIKSGKQAQAILDSKSADLVLVGRQFQKSPGLVWEFADELGVDINNAHQIKWGFAGRRKATKSQSEGPSKEGNRAESEDSKL